MSRRRIATQYPFRRRLDRRWVALRLAAGVPAAQVAAVERAEMGAVHDLLGERSFQRLLGAWREHLALGEEERLARLTRVALDILDLSLAGGDRRVAAFFLAERLAGRHPGRTIARSVEATLARAGDAGWRRPLGEAAHPPPPVQSPHPDAAAVAAEAPDVAAEAATADALRRLAVTRQKLKRRLMAEIEREASLEARPVDALAEAGLRVPGAYVEAVIAAETPEPPPPRPRSPAAHMRRRVTRAVHAYAMALLERRLEHASFTDALADVVGLRPGQEGLAHWARLGP